MVRNPTTGHVSPQFNVVFDGEFSTVNFKIEGKITPNWTDIVQRSSQSSAPENIDPEDTWLTTDLEEDTRKTPSHNPGVSPENNNKMLMSSQSVLHAKKVRISRKCLSLK